MLYSMISRDRSDVMVNVFRCDRKAFNLIVLLDEKKKNLSTAKFEKNFVFFFLLGTKLSKTEEKHVDESDNENGTKEVPIFCVEEKPNNIKFKLCQIAQHIHYKIENRKTFFLPWKMILEPEIILSCTHPKGDKSQNVTTRGTLTAECPSP